MPSNNSLRQEHLEPRTVEYLFFAFCEIVFFYNKLYLAHLYRMVFAAQLHLPPVNALPNSETPADCCVAQHC